MNSLMTRRSVGANVGLRIQVLTSSKTDKTEKDCSPTLRDLREKPKRVKRLSELFEQKPWCFKNGVNWWIDGMSPKLDSKLDSCSKQLDTKKETKREIANGANKLSEILEIELKYISDLNMFINSTMETVKNAAGFIAMKLRDNKFCLLGDLKTIIGLHKIVILPQLKGVATKGMCMKFIKFLIQMIDDDHFYCYISHKLLEKSMKKLHKEWFFSGPHTSDESNPYNILEYYHDWITGICNELIKHPTQNADDLALCMDAQEKLMDLIDLIVQAELVTRISQVADISLEMQFKVFDIIRKHKEIVLPKLLLVPKKSLRFSYRYPLDIMEMGKFIKSYEISMTSLELGYKNLARFFVFERCIIYTTVVDCGRSFSFENHFWVKDVKFSTKTNSAQLINCDHTVLVDHPEIILLLMKLKIKHKHDEITAEIDMNEHDLIKLIDSVEEEDVKKWRRYSLVFPN